MPEKPSGRCRLFCKWGDLKGQSFTFDGEATIGRSNRNSIVLPRNEISQWHAKIVMDPSRGGYVIEDLGSRNGTALDGMILTEPERLGHLHVITLAGVLDFIFQDMEICKMRHGARGPLPITMDPAGDSPTMIYQAPIIPPKR